jgi:hypothetical protein
VQQRTAGGAAQVARAVAGNQRLAEAPGLVAMMPASHAAEGRQSDPTTRIIQHRLLATLTFLSLQPRTNQDQDVAKKVQTRCCAHALTKCNYDNKPAIAQLVEHLTVDICSDQMVPGSIPGGRTFFTARTTRNI